MKANANLHVDDANVIVTEWRFAPGAETGHHVHQHDYIVIPLTDGKLRIGSDEVSLVAGGAYARPAGVAHNVVNASPHEFRFVEVELKSTTRPLPQNEGSA
jgi:quercetin dioxygenase-like cupin family protein